MNGHGPDGPHDRRFDDDDRPTGALRAAIEDWKAAAPPPLAELEQRILASLRAGAGRGRARVPRRLSPLLARRGVRWMAAAAAVLLAVLGLAELDVLPLGLHSRAITPRRILVADALRAAEQAEQQHAAAIAELERAAAPILAQAGDPGLPAAKAAQLLAYRDRLRALDSAIAEVKSILEQNPGHAGVRTVLLAAYMDKTQLLREVLALEKGARS